MKVLEKSLQNAKKTESLRTFEARAHKYDAALCGEHARGMYPHMLKSICSVYRAYAHRELAAGRMEDGLPTSPFRVLDIGCGTGALAEHVLNALPACRLTGVDISPEMLRQARRRLNGEATFVVGDAEKLPFGDGLYDAVVMSDVFHHCPDPRRAAFEAWRVLKHDGVLVLGDIWSADPLRQARNLMLPVYGEGDVRVYSESELCEILGQWFDTVEWKTVNSGSCMAIARK